MSAAADPPAWLDAARQLDDRVAALLADLTEDEASAVALSDWPPLTRRGLPAPLYVDAGTGLRGVDGATAFPAGICLAASFDPALAERYGAAVGAEARAAGWTVLLGPTLDLARDPRGGRVPEAFGEDPELAGLLGAAHVRGVQRNHVIAQVKHYVAYNGEERRTGYGPVWRRGDAIDVAVSEQALRDVYLRPFEAAVAAGAWSMMGSYNRVDGSYVCESTDLLSIPRRDWGWRGFWCPDFIFAVRDDAAALAAGLDVGALDGPGGRTTEMLAAAPDGAVRAAVTNVVRALIGSGLADHPLPTPRPPSTEQHRDLAREAAVAGSVLLVNRDGLLPLGGDVRSVALVGPAGHDAFYVGGGAAAVSVDLDRAVSPSEGLAARGGAAVRVVTSQGSWGDVPLPPVPAAAFRLPDGSGPGVLVETVAEDGTTATVVHPQIDHAVAVEDIGAAWPRRWTTLLTPPVTGGYRLSLELGGRATVRVDGRVVLVGSRELEQFVAGPHYPLQCMVDLQRDHPVPLEIEYEVGPSILMPELGCGPTLRLGWQPPDSLVADAAAVAASCDVAVVLVNQASGEGMDRDDLALPGDQDALVAAVAAANPRTVVVLNTPGAVRMPWLDDVAAVLQVWYPGEQFGTALAAVLFGEAEPGGRLPLTFPRDGGDLPGGDLGPADTPAALRYDEGDRVGYRSRGVAAGGSLFPFGFGLAYATTTCRVVAAEVRDGSVAVRVEVVNDSDRATVHVAQMYASTATDPRRLVAVLRVPVAAHGVATGEAVVTTDRLGRWDVGRHRRRVADGDHVVTVATSATDPGRHVRLRVAGEVITSAEWDESQPHRTVSPEGRRE